VPLTASTNDQKNVEATIPELVCPAEASSLVFSFINSCRAFGRNGTASSMLAVSHLRAGCIKLKQDLTQKFFQVGCKLL